MKHLFFLFFLFISVNLFAQTPGAFSYQAVVRNSSGDVVANQQVTFQISILQDTDAGPVVYSETHSTMTNDYGLATLQIGNGTTVSGTFSPDGWGDALHFIKVEFDPDGGSSFIELSTTQLLAVPYAFHAQTVENDEVNDADADPVNEIQSISISGTELTLSEGGGTVTLPSSGGGDNWGTQTVESDATLSGDGTPSSPLGVVGDLSDNQELSLSGSELSISGGNNVVLPDIDPSNELQTLSLSGTDLTISDGNTITLPSGGSGDDWGTQTVESNATLSGDGTSSSPLSVDGDLTDDQELSLSGNDLTISDGNTVTLPSGGTSLWSEDGDDIYFDQGRVGIGETISGLRKFQVIGETEIGVYAENDDDNLGALFAKNMGSGPAAVFRNYIQIQDYNQGAGKVLTSDAEGNATWQDPPNSSASLWSENNSEIYAESNVGIGTSNPEHDLDIVNPTSSIRIRSTTPGTIFDFNGDAFMLLDKASTSNNANLNLQSEGTTQFYAGLLGNNDFRISTDLNSLNGLEVKSTGDVAASGDLNVSGDIHVDGEVYAGINGDTRMTPVAYGTVVSGNLTVSSGNVTLQDEGGGLYDIIVYGASLRPFNFSASLTLIGTKPGFINADAQADRNKVVVYTREEDGSPEPLDFTFVIYQP